MGFVNQLTKEFWPYTIPFLFQRYSKLKIKESQQDLQIWKLNCLCHLVLCLYGSKLRYHKFPEKFACLFQRDWHGWTESLVSRSDNLQGCSGENLLALREKPNFFDVFDKMNLLLKDAYNKKNSSMMSVLRHENPWLCCMRTKMHRAGPEVIKLFSCSNQLSMTFIMLINVKMPTIVGILTFISITYT